MLDLMRQANRRKWFLWLLILPVVFSFVLAIFLVWGGAGTGRSTLGTNVWLARVNGTEIREFDVERQRQQVEAIYRRQLGEQFDKIAAGINLYSLALNRLLGTELAYQEAARLGFEPTQAEVADAIITAPEFQRAGRFIGREQYVHELRARGYDVTQYEESRGKDLAVGRLEELVGTMVSVSADEVEKAYQDEGQTAEVDYVLLRESDFAASAEPTAREVEAWYRDHRAGYQTPEKRRISYALIDRDALMRTIEIPDDEIRSEYEKNKARYTNPEQRRASHILFKTEPGSAEGEVRAKAEAVLARIRAGEDFATLARQNSEDSSASSGGDLGWFGKGRMVPDFERAAWALADGQVSDLVKTQFGFHIIKVTGTRAAGITPIEEARDQIRQQLAFDKARDVLIRKSEDFAAKLAQQSSSLEGIASQLGYPVKESAPFAKGDPIDDLGFSPQASDEIFRLKQGDVSGAINVGRGVLFARVIGIQPPEPAPLDSVREKVKADLVKSRSMDKARVAAGELLAAGADGFKAAADKKKVEVKSTGEFSRATAPAVFGNEIKNAIFSHKANELVGPLDSPEGVVVVKVIKRGADSLDDVGRKKTQLRAQLLQRKQSDAFSALLGRLQRAAVIDYNQEALNELSRRSSR
jgi:peptidyl-prolyl cis-trans isomerase D